MYSEYQNNPDTCSNEQWNILIVDDDIDVHAATEFALKGVRIHNRNINFSHAYSAREAINWLKQPTEKIDLILLDMVMEARDAGLKLAQWLHNQTPSDDKPIVVLRTGQPGNLTINEALATGLFDGLLEKSSVTFRHLVDFLNAMLAVKVKQR